MRAALLLFDELTGRHLARAIADYRLRHPEASDVLEHLEYLVLEASKDGGSAQERSGALTGPAAREDERMHAEWLTTKQTAEVTSLSSATIRRRIADGSLASTKIGRSRRIRRQEIKALMEASHDEAA